MSVRSLEGFAAAVARHEPGHFDYGGDEHAFISVDTTVGVRLTQVIGDVSTMSFTSPAAVHFIPPEAPSSWQHDRPVRHIQVRIDRRRWRDATGTDPVSLHPRAFHLDRDSSTLVRLLLAATDGSGETPSAYASSLVDTLAHSVEARCAIPAVDVSDTDTAQGLAAVLHHIDNHIAESIRVPDLAAVAGIPRRRFERTFVVATGLSPYRYVLEARLDRAAQMLEQDAIPISEIARRSGFFDQAHLTRLMKVHRGVTPASTRPLPD